MPDKYFVKMVENSLLSGMLNDLKNYSRPNIILVMLKCFRYLASHRDCKSYILSHNGFEKAQEYLEHQDDKVQIEAMKLLNALS